MKWLRQSTMRRDWRKKKFKAQGGRCCYCGVAMLMEAGKFNQHNLCTIDHRLPLSRGGIDHWENVAACCSRCNNRKGDMTEAEFRNELLRSHGFRRYSVQRWEALVREPRSNGQST